MKKLKKKMNGKRGKIASSKSFKKIASSN